MTKRKSISKKVRFEVFKRDGFSCQYCGATPPGALLHVVMDAMELAVSRIPYDEDKAFKYFCGICWNKIRGAV